MRHSAGHEWVCDSARYEPHMRQPAGPMWECLMSVRYVCAELGWHFAYVLLDKRDMSVHVQWSMPDSAGHECVVPSLNYVCFVILVHRTR